MHVGLILKNMITATMTTFYFFNNSLLELINVNDQCIERTKVRGDTRGVGIDKLIQASGSRPLGEVQIKPKCNAPTGVNSSKIKSEIGTIVRNYAPLDVEKWANIVKLRKKINFSEK